MTQTEKTFSPDGMRGSSTEQRHHESHASHRDPKATEKSHTPKHEDHSHDFYDDGLVHSHAWAVNAPDR